MDSWHEHKDFFMDESKDKSLNPCHELKDKSMPRIHGLILESMHASTHSLNECIHQSSNHYKHTVIIAPLHPCKHCLYIQCSKCSHFSHKIQWEFEPRFAPSTAITFTIIPCTASALSRPIPATPSRHTNALQKQHQITRPLLPHKARRAQSLWTRSRRSEYDNSSQRGISPTASSPSTRSPLEIRPGAGGSAVDILQNSHSMIWY